MGKSSLISRFKRKYSGESRKDELQKLIGSDLKKMDETEGIGESKLFCFQNFFFASQTTGLLSILLTVIWIFKYLDGFSLQDPSTEFNFHPTFMIISLVYLSGNSILIYRFWHYKPKPLLKWIHALIHGANLILVIFALFTVIDFHNKKSITNFYSFHSWLGIGVCAIYFLQALGSFLVFMKPGASDGIRKATLPLHVFGGSALFFLSIAACLTGLTEKMLFKDLKAYSQREPIGIYVNAIGILLVLHALLVGYMLYNPAFKRTSPSNQVISLNQEIVMDDAE